MKWTVRISDFGWAQERASASVGHEASNDGKERAMKWTVRISDFGWAQSPSYTPIIPVPRGTRPDKERTMKWTTRISDFGWA